MARVSLDAHVSRLLTNSKASPTHVRELFTIPPRFDDILRSRLRGAAVDFNVFYGDVLGTSKIQRNTTAKPELWQIRTIARAVAANGNRRVGITSRQDLRPDERVELVRPAQHAQRLPRFQRQLRLLQAPERIHDSTRVGLPDRRSLTLGRHVIIARRSRRARARQRRRARRHQRSQRRPRRHPSSTATARIVRSVPHVASFRPHERSRRLEHSTARVARARVLLARSALDLPRARR